MSNTTRPALPSVPSDAEPSATTIGLARALEAFGAGGGAPAPVEGRRYLLSLADAERVAADADALLIVAAGAPRGVARNGVLRLAADFATLASGLAEPMTAEGDERREAARRVVQRAAAVRVGVERLREPASLLCYVESGGR